MARTDACSGMRLHEGERAGRRCPCEDNRPGMPGSCQLWFLTAGQARRAALRAKYALGPGHSVEPSPVGLVGRPYFRLVDACGRQVPGLRFFYGAVPK